MSADRRSFLVDAFLFSPTSSSIITKALWHPWGEAGNSLWILTSDGRLR
jgi:nucleoporin NUP82